MLLRHPSHNAGARVLPYSPLIYNDIKVRTFSVSMRTGARIINIIYTRKMDIFKNKFLTIAIVVVVAWVGIYIFASIMAENSNGVNNNDLYEKHGVDRMHPDKAQMLGETDRPRYD